MYLLTYSHVRVKLDGKMVQHSVITDDWIATLVRKAKDHDWLAVVFLRSLEPLECRRLDEFRAAGVEVET